MPADLNALLDRTGLSQRQLAALIDVSPSHLGKVIKGTAGASTRLQERIDRIDAELPDRDAAERRVSEHDAGPGPGAPPADGPPLWDDRPPQRDDAPRDTPASSAIGIRSGLEGRVALLYEGSAMLMLAMSPNSERMQQTSAVINKHAKNAAKAWVVWGDESPRVARFLESLTTAGAGGQVVMIHVMMLAELWTIYRVDRAEPPTHEPQPAGFPGAAVDGVSHED